MILAILNLIEYEKDFFTIFVRWSRIMKLWLSTTELHMYKIAVTPKTYFTDLTNTTWLQKYESISMFFKHITTLFVILHDFFLFKFFFRKLFLSSISLESCSQLSLHLFWMLRLIYLENCAYWSLKLKKTVLWISVSSGFGSRCMHNSLTHVSTGTIICKRTWRMPEKSFVFHFSLNNFSTLKIVKIIKEEKTRGVEMEIDAMTHYSTQPKK